MSDSNGKPKTLSERLAATLSRTRQEAKKVQEIRIEESLQFPQSKQEFCIICGAIRLDPDITGLTCGKQKCVAEAMAEKRDNKQLEEHIEKIAHEFCDVFATDDADNLLDKIHDEFHTAREKLDTITQSIEERLAPLLNIDTEMEYRDEKQQPQKRTKTSREILDEVIIQINDLIGVINKSEAEEEPA